MLVEPSAGFLPLSLNFLLLGPHGIDRADVFAGHRSRTWTHKLDKAA